MQEPHGANPGILQCHSQNPALPTPEPRGANSGVPRRRSRWDPRHSRLTCEQEGDQAGFLGQEELEAGAAEHVFHHGLGAAGALQERQELLRLLCVLRKNGNSETPPGIPRPPGTPTCQGWELLVPCASWDVRSGHGDERFQLGMGPVPQTQPKSIPKPQMYPKTHLKIWPKIPNSSRNNPKCIPKHIPNRSQNASQNTVKNRKYIPK